MRVAENADESGLSLQLLAVIALLSPAGVHRSLVKQIAQIGNDNDTEAASARVDEELARLVELSLLAWGELGESVIMHRLVARVILERLRDADDLTNQSSVSR